jgi:hypothetical protein
MTILRAGPDPEALVRLQFSPSRTINSLLTDCSWNYSYFRHTPLLLAKINSITHLGWVLSWSMTKEPSIFHKYGLGADVSWTDPLGASDLRPAPKPSWGTPTSAPTSPPHLYKNQTQVTVVEVKDLRQFVAIEIGYGDTNSWMEWIKYSVCTLNKSNSYYWEPRVSGGPVSIRMIFRSRWNVLHIDSVSGCHSFG